ncbi:carboxymuconolactone decarboxylase family protein [Paraburkholderia sp. ZP32-5]|uniref:carboxymuconolactone decarboxylase family protein n=1 Tax=Paraburkholderia sp. ZP32-5 TaxID=2883245 RepID=UPI001F415DF8|nr:carboxymuconolactone decarboxylase family protein [Paraburkholderia sp. ZP32-5]
MRIEALAREQMNDEQRAVHDEASGGRRGKAPVPLTAWIHSPAIAAHAQRLGEALRFESTLPSRVVALAALIVAAHWRAPYVWSAQEAKLRAAGMPDDAIRAIAHHQAPALDDIEDRAAYAAVSMLLNQRALDDATYALAVEVFGERGVVELIAAAGYYTMVAMTLNTFEIDAGASMPD